MALSAQQITQAFEILGVPQNGIADVFEGLTGAFGPGHARYDLAAVVTKIDQRLTALTSSQVTRATTLLARWDVLTSSSPTAVLGSSGSRGVLADHPAEREAIRAALSNLIGVAVPSGGFASEARQGGAGLVR